MTTSLPGSLGRLLGLDRAGLAQALRLSFAAWLAFAIASFLHVGNAYWAAMPVWVVSQATKGLLIERAVFRIAGTLVGAAVGFGLMRLTGDPYLLLALLGLWVALNAGLVKILRGVHGYGAMLSGMTAAIVVLPSVLQPGHTLALAVARVECTLIGVATVTVVTGLWTPASPRQDFYRQVQRLAQDTIGFAAAVLRDPSATAADALERRLLRELGEAQANASLVTAGSLKGYRRLHHVHALVVSSLGVMAAARGLGRKRSPGMPADTLPEDLDLLAGRQPASDLPARIGNADPRLGRAVGRLLLAEAAFATEPARSDVRSFGSKAAWLAPHRDLLLATGIGLAAGGATFAAAILGYLSGWQAGELAALGVCIFSMVLGSLPEPRKLAPVILKGVGAGVSAALLYRLTIQPHVETTTGLILSVAPFILAGGLARASWKTAGPALDANMCFMLASQAVLPAVTDPAIIFSEAAALLLGAVFVVSGVLMLPSRPDRQAMRAAEALGADLLRMTRPGSPPDPATRQARTTRQILRLSLHLEKAAGMPVPPGVSLLAPLELAEAIGRLHDLLARADIAGAARRVPSKALEALQRMREDPEGVAEALEHLADAAGEDEAADILREAVAALRAGAPILARGTRLPPRA